MLRRLVLPALLCIAAYYAVFGGEYSILDVRAMNRESEQAQSTLERLQALTDSLGARADSLEHDDRTLESIARERFGLIRDGEVLYRFAFPPEGAEGGTGRP